jgi:hypothetical protein
MTSIAAIATLAVLPHAFAAEQRSRSARAYTRHTGRASASVNDGRSAAAADTSDGDPDVRLRRLSEVVVCRRRRVVGFERR